MRRVMMAAAMAGAMLVASAPAEAGIFTDDMARCLVTKSSSEDKGLLAKWIFVAIAHDPRMAGLSRISEAEGVEVSKKTAALYQRLMMVDCREQTVLALKADGAVAMGAAFQTLGQVAAREMMSAPETNAFVEQLSNYAMKEEFDKLRQEAGLPPTK